MTEISRLRSRGMVLASPLRVVAATGVLACLTLSGCGVLQIDSPLSLLLTHPVASASTVFDEAALIIPNSDSLRLTCAHVATGVWLEAFVLGEDAMLRCGFPSDLGAGEIAVDLLGQFEAGATVEFFTSAYADVLAGEVRVWFGARRELLVPDRSAFIKGVLE